MDSFGWILYKMGKNKEALEYLQKSYSNKNNLPSANIPEVAAHLGEVLWITDDKKQANKIWRQGLKGDPNSMILLETMERLKK